MLSALIVTAIGSVIVLSQKQEVHRVWKPQEPRRIVTAIPFTYSKVKTLEIVSTRIVDQNTPGAGVAVEIRNNSYKAAMAVDLVCGEGGITKNGLTDEKNPIVVIEPFGTTVITMTFGAMTYGADLVVSAVTYADGTDEGDEESLRGMHSVREHDKAMLNAVREKALVKP
jgi:hypothetical protein